MRNFEVLERCQHYFRCNIDDQPDKYCRILIDENSENLPIGKFRLHVEEITDIYKHYSKGAVFRLTLPFSEQDSISICTLKTGRKNIFTYKACLRLGGKWEPIIGEWVFSASVQDKVKSLGEIIHSETVLVEAIFKETISKPDKSLTLFGFELVKGMNINHTPIFHYGIVLKKGDITYITGNNSKTIVRSGTVVRLQAPRLILESCSFKEDYLSAVQYRVIRRKIKRT